MLDNHAEHRSLIHERIPEIGTCDRACISNELLRERFVERILRAHLGVVRRVSPVAREDIQRIARSAVNQDERRRRDSADDEQGEDETAKGPLQQWTRCDHRGSCTGCTVSANAPVQRRKPSKALRYARTPSESMIQKYGTSSARIFWNSM